MSQAQDQVAGDSQSPSQGESSATDNSSPGPTEECSKEIEEGSAVYRPGGFHLVYIGDIFNDRYEVLNKIGYGVYSTVWLIRDLKSKGGPETTFRALKVLRADCYGHGSDSFEREILNHLRNGDSGQMGYAYVCQLVHDFEHQGPNGTHVCFVFELMGETLRSFGTMFRENMVPTSLMRRFTIQLLVALDFAHEHNVIHTDIKPNNIFVKFRDYSRIESGYLAEVPIPTQDREEERYSVIPSCPLYEYYFSKERAKKDGAYLEEFDIALGDWGVSSWKSQHLTENIQPVALRSPEVLIGAPWDATTDLWNLGAVVHEVYRAIRMFTGMAPPDGHYELKEHLAEIVDYFGPFPKRLLEQGDHDISAQLFDRDGRVKDVPPPTRAGLLSEDFLPRLSEETKDEYVSFLRALMKIDPADRLETMDLLRHPWLGAVAS